MKISKENTKINYNEEPKYIKELKKYIIYLVINFSVNNTF